MEKKKLSLTYRFLRAIGLNYSEQEYGQVSLWRVIKAAAKTYRDTFLLKYVMDSWLLSPILPRKVRPWVLKKIGCHVGKDIFVGGGLKIDSGHADLIQVDDHAHIAGGVRLLCHQRDLSDYCVGDDYAKLGYTLKGIHLCKGSLVGMETMVMPGVTIGEGAIVGAGSFVIKDVPAWTVAVGRPAKVVRKIPERKNETEQQ